MNQSFRILSKTSKISKNFSKINNKVSLSEAFSSKSSFATSTFASSSFTSTFSTSSSFCTAQVSNGGSIINNTLNKSRTGSTSNSNCSSFLEILSLGEDDDDR